jgi:cyclopropane fatty-acyl-phospholipid synthase-like methyltransferase
MIERDGGYDSGYRSCPCFWGTQPSSLVVTLAQTLCDLTALDVLDVGCGEGKNSAFFGKRGASVTAIELSPWALENAKAEWGQLENVRWVLADASAYDFGINAFDVVVAYGVYHCLSHTNEIRQLHSRLSCCTRAGGYHVICSFNARRQELETAHPGFNPCLLGHEDYLDLYADWDLRIATDTDLTEVHPHNKIEHTHSMTRILARKKVA